MRGARDQHLGTALRAKTFASSDLIALLPEVRNESMSPSATRRSFPMYAPSRFAREHVR